MNGADEDRAEYNPEEDRQPAECCRENRSDDGAGSGDGGEVMSQEHGGFGRNVVNAVAHLVRGSWFVRIQPKFAGDKTPVGQIAS